MKKIAVLVAAMALLASAGYADPILSVDMQPSGSAAQSGWDTYTAYPGWGSEWYNVGAGSSKVIGAYTVKAWFLGYGDTYLSAFGSPAFGDDVTLDNMFADGFVTGNWNAPGQANGLEIAVEGLTPGVEYTVTMWNWRGPSTATSAMSWWQVPNEAQGLHWTGSGFDFAGGTHIGTFDSATTAPQTDTDYMHTWTQTADASGKIVFAGFTGSVGGVVLNGFTIEEPAEEPPVVPEPATLLLVGTGALGTFGVIRRRMLK